MKEDRGEKGRTGKRKSKKREEIVWPAGPASQLSVSADKTNYSVIIAPQVMPCT